MARPSVTSVRSKQNKLLRYVVSTDPSKTASDLGVSTETLRRFLSAKPETVKKNPSRYNKLLQLEPEKVAKSKDVKLVQRLSGKRLGLAYKKFDDDRTARAIRLAQATRQRKRVVEEGKVKYVPIRSTQKGQIARKQILSNLSGFTSKSIIEQYRKGDLTAGEAKQLMRKLWRNSDIAVEQADNYFAENS